MLADSRGATPSSPSSPPYPDYHHHHHHHHHASAPAPAYQYKHSSSPGSPPSSPSSASSSARCCSLRGGGGGCCGTPPGGGGGGGAGARGRGRRGGTWCCCCYCPATANANSAASSLLVCLLVLAYTLLGAFTFMGLEGGWGRSGGAGRGDARREPPLGADIRSRTVEKLWAITEDLNILYKDNWTRLAAHEVLKFQKELVESLHGMQHGSSDSAVAKKDSTALDVSGVGTGVANYGHHHRWSFSSSFLYSLTLITTIGYGSVAPKTTWGKVITILYALVGIPLMLVYLSTVGDVLARNFRRLYSRLCGGGGGGGGGRGSGKGGSAAKSKYLSTGFTPAGGTKGHNNILAADGSAVKLHHFHSEGSDDLSGKMGRSASMAVLECGEGVGASSTSSLDPSSVAGAKYHHAHRGRGGGAEGGGCAGGGGGAGEGARVPVWLCLLIVALYICGGAVLFHWLENWTFLEGSYFCFTSLGTIGFGDLLPGGGAGGRLAEQLSAAAASAYILLGMAVIAMCFSLAQDEVVVLVRKLGKYFGSGCGGPGVGGGAGSGGGAGRAGDEDEDLILEGLEGEGIAMAVVSSGGAAS